MRIAGYVAAARASAPVVVATLGVLSLAVATSVFVNSEGFGYDFRAYDSAARRIAAGEPLYLPDTIEAYREGRYEGLYLYPPPLAIALVPLTALGESAATMAWMVLRIVLLAAGCLALPVSHRARLATLGVAGLSFPVLFDLNIGNVSIVVFALCVVGWRWMGSPLAAVTHAALALVRFPFVIYGLLWLAQRQYRMLAWTLAAGIGLVVIGLPILGMVTFADYVAILRGLPDISTGAHNLSVRSTALDAGLPDALAALTLPVSYLLGGAAIIFAARRRDQSAAFVVTATSTMLIAPFIHPHYLVLLLLPAALLVDRGRWWGVGLPLLGWLPDPLLPLVGVLAVGLVLAVTGGRSEREDWVHHPSPA